LTLIRRGMIWFGTSNGRGHSVFSPVLITAACLFAGMGTPSPAGAQVILIVNGEVITNWDIDQRAKFNMLATHKNQPRHEIIEELIDDKLKAQIAKRYKIDLTEKDVDAQYADMAKRMHISADQLTQQLSQGGVDAKTLKAKILSDLSWQYIIRGKFQSEFQINDTAVQKEIENQKKGDGKGDNKGDATVGYDYTLRPILFLVPRGNTAMLEAHRKDAEALRARFTNCDTDLPAARAQHDVIIRDKITKNSSDLEPALREILNKTEVGHLTQPETTLQGVELVAVCERKETTTETPEKRQWRERLFAQRFEAVSKRYLRDLRRQAMIETKQ
jgi:peptidyl-prolyl cis-trans isomerase SurA